MTLNLHSLIQSITALDSAITVSENAGDFSDAEKNVIRSGVIQHFGFTYELCWKFMKRYLENNLGSQYVDGVSRQALFRLTREHHLISDVTHWMDYHKARNLTSQTYEQDTAQEVYDIVKPFFQDATFLLNALKERND